MKARLHHHATAGLLLLSACTPPKVRPDEYVGVVEPSRAEAMEVARHCNVRYARWDVRARMLYLNPTEARIVRQCVTDHFYWSNLRHEPAAVYRLIVDGI